MRSTQKKGPRTRALKLKRAADLRARVFAPLGAVTLRDLISDGLVKVRAGDGVDLSSPFEPQISANRRRSRALYALIHASDPSGKPPAAGSASARCTTPIPRAPAGTCASPETCMTVDRPYTAAHDVALMAATTWARENATVARDPTAFGTSVSKVYAAAEAAFSTPTTSTGNPVASETPLSRSPGSLRSPELQSPESSLHAEGHAQTDSAGVV